MVCEFMDPPYAAWGMRYPWDMRSIPFALMERVRFAARLWMTGLKPSACAVVKLCALPMVLHCQI